MNVTNKCNYYQGNLSSQCKIVHTTSNDLFAEDLLNVSYAFYHFISIIVFLSFMAAMFRCQRPEHRNYMLKFSVHNLRWILSICLCVFQLAAIIEGIMTSQTVEDQAPSFLFYIPSICAILSSICLTTFYHFMEIYHEERPVFLISLYLSLSFIFEIFRLRSFVEIFDYRILKFYVIIGLIVNYGVLLCISVHHVFGCLKKKQHKSVSLLI